MPIFSLVFVECEITVFIFKGFQGIISEWFILRPEWEMRRAK